MDNTLYELSEQYQDLLWLLEDGESDQEEIEIALDKLEEEMEIKLEQYGRIIRELEGDVVKIKAEMERLTKKKKAAEQGIATLKASIFGTMKNNGEKKLKTENFTFNIAKNGGSAPVILDVKVEELPDEYVIISEKADLKKLAEEIKNGGSKFAHFGERGESLRIK